MISRKKLFAAAAGVLILGIAALAVNAASSGDTGTGVPTTFLSPTSYVYSVKYVCGAGDASRGIVVPGSYLTSVNVHNPQLSTVVFTKKVAQSPSEDAPPIPPSQKRSFQLLPDYAFEIDCTDIAKIGNITAPFSEGYVVLETPMQLDVTAVYTGMPAAAGGGITMEVETVKPKQRIPTISARAIDLPSD